MPNGTLVFPHGQEQPRPALPSAKYQGIYKRNAILCFPAGCILPPAPYTGLSQAQKAWGGLPFQFFFKKQMKMSGQLKNEHKNIKNSDDSGQAVLGREKETRGAGPGRHLPAHCPSASNPALQEGAPPQSPEAWPEGEGTRAWGLGAQAPPTKPRGRAKGGL